MTSAATNLSQRLAGRRAFITGAASGLGLACAEILAREGWQLVLTDVDASRLDLVASSFSRDGARVAAIACDVRDAAAMTQLVDSAVATLGGIDLAINCAGVALAGAFHHSTAEEWQWIFDINVHGVANSCRPVIRHMGRGKGGLIINIASIAAVTTSANMSAYNASKAAVVAFSESLMQEYADYGVQVMVAMPGFFKTRLIESARGDDKTLKAAGRLLEDSGVSAEDVAEQMLAAAGRGSSHFIYPRAYRTYWRLKRLMPQYFQKLLPRLVQSRKKR
ncbi:MAG: SDR family NAD(P)-dependent oxidoreductase [Gammaproteobacteria bacterium]